MTVGMLELVFEIGRFTFIIGTLIFIGWLGWTRQLYGNWAWRFSILAFLLLLFGITIDVIDDYQITRDLGAGHDMPLSTFLEKGVGYLGGFASMLLAAICWLPHSDALKSQKDAAERARTAAEWQRDILRDQLTQVQKMEAIGALTGGIAHDFNNLLMIIDGYTRRAAKTIDQNSAAADSLQQALGAIKRASALTKQLLVFSRRQRMEKKVFRVSDLIASVRGLLVQAAGEQNELQLQIQDGACCIETDSNEFSQTLLNLTINARDAMPDGGTITIASRMIAGGNGKADLMEISVADTGTGMEKATIERIFEPFFTTKERGKGTGLGLATTYGFMHASEGEIRVQSEPGSGTTMSLLFPVSHHPVTEAPTETKGAPRGRGETVLLVEDNESILKLIHSELTDLGYNMLSAPSGFEALEIEMSWNKPIDILCTDVVMPGLSGIEVAQVVRARRPTVKIVFMSGYTDDIKKSGLMPNGAMFLQKPLDIKRLAEVIRAQLDQPEMSEAS